MNISVKDCVIFGKQNGEQTLGRVLGIGPKRVKIEQLEARGSHPIGTIWRVDPKLIWGKIPTALNTETTPPAHTAKVPTPKSSWGIWDRVWFEHQGHRYEGAVTKINRKTVQVRVDGNFWRVSPDLLRSLDDGAR